MQNNTLVHYGVKGMRWGVRKDRTRGKKKVSQMTDSELKAAVSRLELERRYNQLSSPKNSPSQIVSNILLNSGKAAVTSFTTSQLTRAINNAVGNK